MAASFGPVTRDPETGLFRLAPSNRGSVNENITNANARAEAVTLNPTDDSFYEEMLSLMKKIHYASPKTSSTDVKSIVRELKGYIRILDARIELPRHILKELVEFVGTPSAMITLAQLKHFVDRFLPILEVRAKEASNAALAEFIPGKNQGGGRRITRRARTKKLKGGRRRGTRRVR